MVDDFRHWDLEDEVRDSVLCCDVDLSCAADLARQERSADELSGPLPSTPPAALDPPDDADPSIR